MAIRNPLKTIWHDCAGATAVEYAGIAGLIVFAIFASIQTLGSESSDHWDGVATDVVGAMNS